MMLLAQEVLGVFADVARGVVSGDPLDEVAGASIGWVAAGKAGEELPADLAGTLAWQRRAEKVVIRFVGEFRQDLRRRGADRLNN